MAQFIDVATDIPVVGNDSLNENYRQTMRNLACDNNLMRGYCRKRVARNELTTAESTWIIETSTLKYIANASAEKLLALITDLALSLDGFTALQLINTLIQCRAFHAEREVEMQAFINDPDSFPPRQ